jgi:hypothetical protein
VFPGAYFHARDVPASGLDTSRGLVTTPERRRSARSLVRVLLGRVEWHHRFGAMLRCCRTRQLCKLQRALATARHAKLAAQHNVKWQRVRRQALYEDIERVATRFSGFYCIFGCRGTASRFDSKAATVPRVCQAGGALKLSQQAVPARTVVQNDDITVGRSCDGFTVLKVTC